MDDEEIFDRHEDESVVVPPKASLRDSYIRTDTPSDVADGAEWPAVRRLIRVFPSEAKYCGVRRTKRSMM